MEFYQDFFWRFFCLLNTKTTFTYWTKRLRVFFTYWTKRLLIFLPIELEDWYRALSASIRSVSRRFVSENCVAITTRHRLIIKKAPIWKRKKIWTEKKKRNFFVYNDKKNEIRPIPKRMRVLNIIHNVRPSFQTDHQKNRDPSESDVVETNWALEGIPGAGPTFGVILIPIDAGIVCRWVIVRESSGRVIAALSSKLYFYSSFI